MSHKKLALLLVPLVLAVSLGLGLRSVTADTGTRNPDELVTIQADILPGDWVVTRAEAACLTAADTVPVALDCVEMPSFLRNQARYLERETEATPDQVACVVDVLGGLPIEEARAVALAGPGQPGFGEVAYVPCGLPD